MKVKMKTTATGPETHLISGQVYDLPAQQATDLIEGNYAEAVAQSRKETAESPDASTKQTRGRKK